MKHTKLTLVIVASFALLACVLPSIETRHAMWIQNNEALVGADFFQTYWGRVQMSGSGVFHGAKQLPNGNTESKFGNNNKNCTHFFEYEPSTGKIIKFRYETNGQEKYVCYQII